MNLHPPLEATILLSAIIISTIGSFLILRHNPKRYLFLWLTSGVLGELICYLQIRIGFYSFPYRLFPQISTMPFMAILTVFPFYVMFSTRFGPDSFKWRVPFIWAMVHIGVSFELYAVTFTQIIRYQFAWDIFDSYVTWWLYILLFDYVGRLIVPRNARRPLDISLLYYGKSIWLIGHFIFIISIFMFGFYTGKVSPS